MPNLRRFRDSTHHSDWPEQKVCSERDTYTCYEKAIVPMVESRGGRVAYHADAKNSVMGPPHENWD